MPGDNEIVCSREEDLRTGKGIGYCCGKIQRTFMSLYLNCGRGNSRTLFRNDNHGKRLDCRFRHDF